MTNSKENAANCSLGKINQVDLHRDHARVARRHPLVEQGAKSRIRKRSTTARSSPEKGGLFWNASSVPSRTGNVPAANYKRIKHRGVVCDRCELEVTLARVRRERMGPSSSPCRLSYLFFKCMPRASASC